MTEYVVPPLDQLLSLGAAGAIWEDWADYLALGITREQVPELIRMATDPTLHDAKGSVEVWAPVHAWRALGQLRAEAAVQPLTDLLARMGDDWVQDDLPQALGAIGGAAIAPARELMASDDADLTPRVSAIGVLNAVARRHPELRGEVVGALTAQLALWPDQDPDLNAILIDDLAKHRVVEAAPIIEAAFEGGVVSEFLCGDWEDVQVRLGLLGERTTPVGPRAFASSPPVSPLSIPSRPGAGAKSKSRRKEARAARKRNRRR